MVALSLVLITVRVIVILNLTNPDQKPPLVDFEPRDNITYDTSFGAVCGRICEIIDI